MFSSYRLRNNLALACAQREDVTAMSRERKRERKRVREKRGRGPWSHSANETPYISFDSIECVSRQNIHRVYNALLACDRMPRSQSDSPERTISAKGDFISLPLFQEIRV
jgi:hypothetical protein